MEKLFATVLVWLLVLTTNAQITKVLTTADGLPNSTITGMVQDQTGFIWLTTADGLARYDGRQVKVFRHDGTPNSLAENTLSSLQFLPDGTLLLQTRTGDFQRFDSVLEQFYSFLPLAKQGKRKIDTGLMAPDGHTFWAIWRGEKIQCFDSQLHLHHSWDEHSLGRATKTLHCISPASNGRVYAHYDEGLVELNAQTSQHRLLPYRGPMAHWLNRVMPIKDWKAVAERPNGEIMVIGLQYLLLLNPQTGQYRDLAMPGEFVPNGAYALRVLTDGKVYLTIGHRLYELLPNDQFTLVHEWEAPPGAQRSYGLPFLYDRSGVLWLHTHMGNLILLDRQPKPFQTYPYRTDWKSDLLRVVLGIAPPDWKDSNGDSWTRFTGANGHLWFIDLVSLYRYDLRQRRLTRTSTADNCTAKIALKPDVRDMLWVYGNEIGGLTEMDSAGRVKRLWPNSLVPQPLENRGLDLADIQPISNSVWMASYQGKGLYRYDLRQKKIVAQVLHNPANRQSLPTNQLLCLAADPHRPTVLWIGTVGGGLTRFDTQTGRFRTFTEKDGLPNNTINSLLTDRQGFLWVGTNKGLARIDPRSFRIRRFSRVDGLQDDEFGHTLAVRLPDGRLAFGGRTGITVFDPAALREDTFEPPVVLSGLTINNEAVEAGQEKSPLLKPINALSELTLDHTQNFLTFTFAALQYNKPDKIQYRYRLTGVDPDWITTNGQNTANYTQLAPGDYEFAVMATNADGRWSRHVKGLAVVITPPFWATWWAYAGYFLLFVGLVFGFIRLRLNRLREQQELQLQHREAEQLKAVDELKTRFFSNITHEFRTPLTLILSPTEKLLQEPKHDAPTRQTLTSVHRNAGQLLLLVNQLLDLSKLEGGGMAVSLARGNVAEFIEQLVDTFRASAEQKSITLTLQADTGEGDQLFDADKWLKISTNLVANALKFTPTGGAVSVRLTNSEPGAVCLTVADTGIGIRAEKLPHIFDRFFQIDDTHTRAYDGTGIGLALVKELIDVLGGTIVVESQPGKGTTFTLQLPVLPALADATISTLVLPKAIQTELTSIHSQPDPVPTPIHTDEDSATMPLLLVVEDNDELRSFIVGELVQMYRVLTATNGEEGWQLAQTELPDLVVSDVMMPLMDGYELTRHLKTTSLTSHIGVILLSARAAHESRMAGLTQGADDYLTKPFHVDELRQRLHNLLTRQQTLRDYYHRQFARHDTDFKPETITDDFLRQLHAEIDGQLDNPAFGVDELARQVGMSRRTLNRKLAAVANLSANNVIRQHRLKRAAQFLREGRNVSEAAYLVGYESPAHFSQIFREFFQKSPSEFTQK